MPRPCLHPAPSGRCVPRFASSSIMRGLQTTIVQIMWRACQNAK